MLIVIDAFTKGGAQKVLIGLIPEWLTQGHKVKLVLIQNSLDELSLDYLQEIGVETIRLQAKSLFSLKSLFNLIRISRQFQANMIQCHLYWAQVWGGITKCFNLKTKLVWVEHNTYFRRTRAQWIVFKLFSRFSSEIIGVSTEVCDFLASKKINKVRFIPNPILQRFSLKNFGERDSVFTFVGRLSRQKNPMLALKAFELALLNGKIPTDSKLMIVGDGPMKQELVEYIDKYELKTRVFLTGFIEEDQLAYLLNNSRALMSTSDYEGCPLARLEAFACGCAIITTRTGGINGVLSSDPFGEDLLSGVFIVKNDAESISDALHKVILSNYWSKENLETRIYHTLKFQPAIVAADYMVTRY